MWAYHSRCYPPLADGTSKAIAPRPRQCTMCRECIRRPEWAKRIALERLEDHYICAWRQRRDGAHAAGVSYNSPFRAVPAVSIESTGALPARDLLREALRVLREKCADVKAATEAAQASDKEISAADRAKLTMAAMTTEADDLA